ncbi:ubiquitin thioesterase [Biomphalaria pfeifferi]|uniref:Ubiquitin thioesterase n=1 Tax=Biomphalaria pfeifferi TaxID=112525 RepID=A0AAD8BQ00_BIOPF|nr:ubiquitin thioesterase [Biomphalaria pfeifferi]
MRYEVQVTKHYPSLREAFLKSFEYTSDGYKGKFRTARIERGETYQLIGTKIKGYLNKWVQMSGAEQTFEGLLQLLLIDQLLNGASEGLTIFLKERNPTSWDQTLELSENYRLAHVTRSLETSKSKPMGEGSSLGYMGSRSTPHTNYATDKRVTFSPRGGLDGRQAGRYDNRHGEGDAKIVSPVGAVQEGRATAPRPKAGHKRKGKKPVVWLEEEGRRPIADGFLNGTPIKVLRDTGSSVVVVQSTLAPKLTGRFRWIKTINSTMLKVATAMVKIDSPYFTGEVEAHLLDHPLYDCVVGNLPGAADPFQPNPNWRDAAKVTFEESEASIAKISSSAEVNGVIPPCSSNLCDAQSEESAANGANISSSAEVAGMMCPSSPNVVDTLERSEAKGANIFYFKEGAGVDSPSSPVEIGAAFTRGIARREKAAVKPLATPPCPPTGMSPDVFKTSQQSDPTLIQQREWAATPNAFMNNIHNTNANFAPFFTNPALSSLHKQQQLLQPHEQFQQFPGPTLPFQYSPYVSTPPLGVANYPIPPQYSNTLPLMPHQQQPPAHSQQLQHFQEQTNGQQQQQQPINLSFSSRAMATTAGEIDDYDT